MLEEREEPLKTLSPACESALPLSHSLCRQDEMFVPIKGGDIFCPCACHIDREEAPDTKYLATNERKLMALAWEDWQRRKGTSYAGPFKKLFREIEKTGFINWVLSYRAYLLGVGLPGFDGYVQLRTSITELLAQKED